MIKYDECGAPVFEVDEVMPKRDPFVVLFTIIPLLWGCTIGFYFYAAVTNYKPPFCTKSGFFGYTRF